MIPAAFAYERPSSLDEALGLLARNGDSARLATVLEALVSATRAAAQAYAPIIPRAAFEAQRRLVTWRDVEIGPPLFPRRV